VVMPNFKMSSLLMTGKWLIKHILYMEGKYP
jgi:hypothetical protein